MMLYISIHLMIRSLLIETKKRSGLPHFPLYQYLCQILTEKLKDHPQAMPENESQSCCINNKSKGIRCQGRPTKRRHNSFTPFNRGLHDEIKSRLNSGNACYYSLQNLLSSRLT
jgi:hypothetical protein